VDAIIPGKSAANNVKGNSMFKKKVLLGMSGGVDSSVAAFILQKQGYDVTGVTMRLWNAQDGETEISRGCCSLSEVEDAKRVCHTLGIPHYVMNLKDEFKACVVDYFVGEYVNGKTPNPCIACNAEIKFKLLLHKALAIGFDYIATGHYAMIDYDNGLEKFVLKKSVTDKKDQTYVLYNLTQFQLQHLLFPIGNFTKEEVRKIAEEIGLCVSNKPDSQEICFIPDNDHGNFIKNIVSKTEKKGFFKDINNNILGEHKGIYHYTIGQRKGLGIATGSPLFVININPESNTVTLGEEKLAFTNCLEANKLNFIIFDQLTKPMKVKTKIRYSAKEADSEIYPLEGDRVLVKFDTAQRAITPGQSVVFYSNDCVVGGGIVEKSYNL
jgi:tRNA-uridine 2-sulfurtransferase